MREQDRWRHLVVVSRSHVRCSRKPRSVRCNAIGSRLLISTLNFTRRFLLRKNILPQIRHFPTRRWNIDGRSFLSLFSALPGRTGRTPVVRYKNKRPRFKCGDKKRFGDNRIAAVTDVVRRRRKRTRLVRAMRVVLKRGYYAFFIYFFIPRQIRSVTRPIGPTKPNSGPSSSRPPRVYRTYRTWRFFIRKHVAWARENRYQIVKRQQMDCKQLLKKKYKYPYEFSLYSHVRIGEIR